MKTGSKTTNRILFGISMIALAWVVYKLWSFNEWGSFVLYIKQHRLQIPGLLALQFILLTMNIGLETRRWQLLVRPVSRIPFREAFFQVIKGIQLGMVTPARTGDPVGKSFFFKPKERTRVIILSLTGSVIQNIIILLTSSWAVFYLEKNTSALWDIFSGYYPGGTLVWCITVGGVIVLGSCFFLKRFVITRSLLLNLRCQFRVLQESKTITLLKIGGLTALRYLVFTVQFFIFLRFFGVTDARNGLSAIFLFYGAISFLPSAGAGDLGIRTTVALWVFGQITISGPAIVMSSSLLWFFNLGLPSLLPSIIQISAYLKPSWQKNSLPT